MVRTGPSSASGGITTFTREPSGRRASHSGSASSTRRPSGARIRSIAWRSSPSEANADRGGLEPPAALDPRRRGAAHEHLVDLGSASSGSSGPRPNERSAMRATSASREPWSSTDASRSTKRADALLGVVGRAGLRRLREHALAQGAGEARRAPRAVIAASVLASAAPPPRAYG
jgi:hypothetical protein